MGPSFAAFELRLIDSIEHDVITRTRARTDAWSVAPKTLRP